MKTFSARTLIDDILLIVRNNNISESEDLSRDQVLSWIMQHKAYLSKKEDDKDSETGDDEDPDDSQLSTIGPLELIDDPIPGSEDDCCCHCSTRKRTKKKLYTMEDSSDDIVSVTDVSGCVIQIMNKSRKHYHNLEGTHIMSQYVGLTTSIYMLMVMMWKTLNTYTLQGCLTQHKQLIARTK